MSNGEKNIPTAHELMQLHVEAMFKHDRNLRLRGINEPWPGEVPAPRFFLGRTIEGTSICRFRYDVPEEIVEQLQQWCADEPILSEFRKEPKHYEDYRRLLQGERFTMGPCFLVPEELKPTMQVMKVTGRNRGDLFQDGFAWLASEIDYAQPCVALVHEGRAVSICRSVRIASGAHEAGLETLEAYRGKGYAAAVVAGWAAAVREAGCLPLYSTSWDNLASRSVGRKAALSFYGANFAVF